MSVTQNPFDILSEKIDDLQKSLLTAGKAIPPEIIDRAELCKRLKITEPTVIRWEKKKKIPAIRIGSAVRYNWTNVVRELEK